MTKYDKSIRDKAYSFYIAGEPVERFCKKIGISKRAFYDWKKKYGWEEEKDRIQKKMLTESNETITDIKKRQHQIVKGIMSKYIQDLKAQKIDVSTSEIARIMSHELLLIGEATQKVEVDIFDELSKEVQNRKKRRENKTEVGESEMSAKV